MNEFCDVLIIGGGPAGSSCAWVLNQAGYNVMVLDKATFPRDKVCAGWITPQIIDCQQLDLAEYGQQRVLQPITGFITGLIDGKTLRTEYDSIVSYGIRRTEFDHYLLKRAGVRCRFGTPLRSWEFQHGHWLINNQIKARMLVSCAGHFCPIARQLNKHEQGNEHVVVAQESEFLLTEELQSQCDLQATVPELYFCRDLKGYGWCVRKGNYLNIGLGREGEQNLSAHVQHFLEFLRQTGKIQFELPARFKGHAYRLNKNRHRKLVDDHLLICGDAAGLAYPQSGEGIRPAVESGLLAGWTLIQANGDFSSKHLQCYQQELQNRFGNQTEIGFIPASIQQWIGGTLLANSKWFVKNILIQQWFLHQDLPNLANPFQQQLTEQTVAASQ